MYERVQGACAAGDVIDVNCLQSMTCAQEVGRWSCKWDAEVCAGTHVNTCIDVHYEYERSWVCGPQGAREEGAKEERTGQKKRRDTHLSHTFTSERVVLW